jgi:hypothetical protein
MIAVLRQGYGGRSPLVIFMDFPDQVYILKCADGHMYVHYTGSRLPVQCIAAFGFIDKSKVFNFEKYLKTGSGQISPHAWSSI